jgi:hypothetical protein
MNTILEATYYQKVNGDKFISVIFDGVEMSVPIDPANRHYAVIMEMVDAGTLTIAEADNGE